MKNMLFFFLLSVSLNAQTIYVNSTSGNDGTGNGSSGSPYKTFTKGYSMVSSDGTLNLTGTFTLTDAAETGDASTSGFTISKNLTIQGASASTLAIIQAASSAGSASSRIFSIESAITVTLKNLEIRYGNLTGDNDGGGLTITNGTVNIDNCYVHDNHSRQGAGINATPSSASNLTITNSTISSNTGGTGGSYGAGINLQGLTNAYITNSTIYSNTGITAGGGISIANSLVNCTITNCTIASNTAQYGGGIELDLGTLTIKNTLAANNSATMNPTSNDVDFYHGTFTDNGYNIFEYYYITYASGSISAATISDNQTNLFGTDISTTPSLAQNNSSNGTPTIKTVTGSVTLNRGKSSANGSVSVPTTDQRGAGRYGPTDIGAYEWWSDDAALPVELTSFSASLENNKVTLNWQTATEVNNYGFEVQKSVCSKEYGENDNWEVVGFVEGNGNSNSIKQYSFVDKDVVSGSYSYRLKQIDIDGSFTYSKEVEVKAEAKEMPGEFALFQNYPNPFNPTTVISYQLPVVSKAQLKVYDILGNEVATLVDEMKEPGVYEVEFNASQLPSGVYFYQLQTGSGINISRKLLLMK